MYVYVHITIKEKFKDLRTAMDKPADTVTMDQRVLKQIVTKSKA